MELRQLRYFLTLAEELHFGRASQRLYIAQPSLTQQIQNLENELGVKLFLRTKRRVELTEAGQFFLTEVRLVFEHLNQAIQVVQRAGRGEIGRLSLAYAGATIYSVVPPILQAFHHRYPNVDLSVREVSTENQFEMFDQHLIHVGILHPPIRRDDIAYETIFREPMVLALPENNPLTAYEKLTPDLLANEAFILFPRAQGPWLHDRITSLCQKAGFNPRVVHETCPPNAVLGLVAANIGIAFVAASLQNVARPGVAYRYLVDALPIELETAIAWHKTLTSPVLLSFIGVVRDVVKTGLK